LRPIRSKRPRALWEVGLRVSSLEQAFTSAVVNCYEATGYECAARFREYVSAFGTNRDVKLRAAVRIGAGGLDSESEVANAVEALAREGADGVAVYNYGLMTSAQRGWLETALMGRMS